MTKLLHLRSSTAGVAPALDNLTVGQLAINTTDGTLWTMNTAGTIVMKLADQSILANTVTTSVANTYGALSTSAPCTNLDTQFNQGSYYVASTASGTFPVSAVNGTLIVGNNNGTTAVFQIFGNLAGTFDGSLWTRQYQSGAWSAWVQLYTTANSGSALVKTINSNAPTAGNYVVGGIRNKLINPTFAVNQYGTLAAGAVAGFVSDRWYMFSNGATITRPTTGFSGSSTTFLSWQETAGTGVPYLSQSVEDVSTFNNTVSCLSFDANPSKSMTLTPTWIQCFGTGGSTTVTTTGTPITLTAGSWNRYIQSVSLPSIAGKTIGANHYVRVQLACSSAPGTFTLGLSDFMWELGPNYNGLFLRDWSEVLDECLYYYEVASGTPFIWCGQLANGNVPSMTIQYRYKRTASPAITYQNFSSTNVATGNPTIGSQSNQASRLTLPAGNQLLGGFAVVSFGATINAELPVSP